LITQEQKNNRQLAIWLLVCCGLIFSMVILGGATRLTGSGLSMVDWKPIMGAIPPLTEESWQETFSKYKNFPEYKKVNKGMSLDEFKSIFWYEYGHRLLGRTIGIVFLIPFLIFLALKKIKRELIPKLITMFLLGGLQGLLGWYMVKSGLVDNPRVSQYRLTAHLGAAVLIYGYILWVALGLLENSARRVTLHEVDHFRKLALVVTTVIIIMILSGGFVAGTRAGYVFNTFPLMYEYFIPPGMFAMEPWYMNLFENLATIQFNHRMIAYAVIVLILILWFRIFNKAVTPGLRLASHLLLLMMMIQITLGISTLVLVVPVALGVAHQGGAILLLTISLVLTHKLRK